MTSSRANDDSQEPTRLGQYTIVRKLGSGAMATVYAARNGEGGVVALKVIHPHLLNHEGFLKRFEREAAAGTTVLHDNVVRTLDLDLVVRGETPYCFLVMEYMEGWSLREIIRQQGRLPDRAVRNIGTQIAAGLSAIHAEGIVHRDLKPENLLIDKDKHVRIMDLGVARIDAAGTPITSEGLIAGSLPYTSPEQIRATEVGPPSDLYALGVVLYELGTGHNPFRRDNSAAVMYAHLETVPPAMYRVEKKVSRFLSTVARILLRKSPENRFPNAAFLAKILREGEESEWWSRRRRRR